MIIDAQDEEMESLLQLEYIIDSVTSCAPWKNFLQSKYYLPNYSWQKYLGEVARKITATNQTGAVSGNWKIKKNYINHPYVLYRIITPMIKNKLNQ